LKKRGNQSRKERKKAGADDFDLPIRKTRRKGGEEEIPSKNRARKGILRGKEEKPTTING